MSQTHSKRIIKCSATTSTDATAATLFGNILIIAPIVTKITSARIAAKNSGGNASIRPTLTMPLSIWGSTKKYRFPMTVKIEKYKFFSVEPNNYGKWCVNYYRDDTRCSRPLLDSSGNTIHKNERRPNGNELVTVIESIIGRKLKRREEDRVFDITVNV